MENTGRGGHVVIASDKFKGSLTARQVADRIAAGLRDGAPEVALRTVLVADGGDGTLDALTAAGFTAVPVTVDGPTGEPVGTSFVVRDDTAVIELADACGLVRLPDARPAPSTASSYGVGQVVAAALDAGYRDLIIAVGGSASSDGGAGMIAALGGVLLDAAGHELPRGGGALTELARLDLSGLHSGLGDAHIVLASDVDNPLLGPSGAVAVYGAQKGANGPVADHLEAGLARWAQVVAEVTGMDESGREGAGAAGGVGFAAMAVLRARMRPGIDLLLDLVRFTDELDGARLVITGEGSLDRQTLQGKAPVGVARAARRAQVPVVAVCGRNSLSEEEARSVGIAEVFA
ncbi:MAG: glycerate kinase, partial [Georgenia sp.]